MIWVVTANAIACHIYDYDKTTHALKLVKEIEHPENRLKKEDFLTSDKPGHYKSSATNRGAYSPRTDPKDVEYDNFARQIAKELDHGRVTGAYEKLIIITPPKMEGMISLHMDKLVKDKVINHIQKDPQNFTMKELLHCLQTNAKYPD